MNFDREKSILVLMSFAATVAIGAGVSGCSSSGSARPAQLTSGGVVAAQTAQTMENEAVSPNVTVAVANQPGARNANVTNTTFDLRMANAPAKAAAYEMLVESAPSGAAVVIDGTPVGKAPCRVLLNGSANGFCLNAFSIKVRFIADGDGGHSQTVEEAFSKHDKIPAKLRFTSDGATRVLREE